MARPLSAQKRIEIPCQGLIYKTPICPEISTIRGSHLPKHDQVWYRDLTYEQFDWELPQSQWTPKQLKWLDEEIERLHVGTWIMINGTPTYFNNWCYFFFQFFVLQEGFHPIYKDVCLEYFYFFELTEIDPVHVGDIGIKGRRVGLSSMSASIKLLIGLLESNTLSGIISKTEVDAQEMFYFVKNGLENLPVFLMPELKKVTESEIFIAKKAKNTTSVSADKGKNNRIDFRATSENAYDQSRKRHMTIDECLHPDTKIMIEGYTFKAIKDIKIGDRVVVEGGKILPVMKKFEGYDEMFLIEQPYSEDYIVSSKHRLYLDQRCKVDSIKDDGIKYHTPEEFLALDKYRTRTTHGLRSSGIDFPEKSDLYISPYIFGAWLGDGRHSNASFICNYVDEPELLSEFVSYGQSLGFTVTINPISYCKKAVNINYTAQKRGDRNQFVAELKRLNVYKNKHIPIEYLHNSRENRLHLLAGIIDTDGHSPKKGKKGSFEIGMSRKSLIEDIRFLALSLGFSVSRVKNKTTNFNTASYKIAISGNLEQIPTKVKRKQNIGYEKQYAFRRNKINVKPIGVGKYVGIQVMADNDDDRRLILEDFTLTMNCAKWIKVSVVMFYAKVLETCYVGTSLVGHISMFSSVNKGDQGGDNFRILWDGSDHINGKMDDLGRTKTRLMRFFFAGYRGLMGYVGKYGESIVDTPTKAQSEYLKTLIDPTTGKLICPNPYIGAKEYLEINRKALENDPEELAEQIRKYPFTWQEVFRGANNRCNFELEDLNEQIASVEEECRLLGQQENGRRMKMEKRSDGEKHPVENKSGMWYFLDFCKDNNKTAYKGNVKCPANTILGCGGLDTYANAKNPVDPGSDACLIVMSRYNALDPENSHRPIAMFLGRPTTKEDFHDQIFWGLEYFGIDMLAERAPTDWEDYAIRHRLAADLESPKLYGYLITAKRANGSETYGIHPSGKEYMEQHLTEMIEYAKFNMKKIRFLRLLKDMLKFDIKERTDYDACMAFGYSLMGLKKWQQIEKIVVTPRQFMKNKRSKSYF